MKTAFLFPGQGSQAVGMGKKFFDERPEARELFGRADEALGYSISELCFNGPEEELKLTRNTQPALLVVSTIASRLLGREPDMAAGHSLGEYSALVAAGALDFEDAVRIVHNRGRYMQEAVPVGRGAMAAVLGKPMEEIRIVLSRIESGVVEIANWNSRDQIVIAGEAAAVQEAAELMRPARSVMLPVSAPFHCRLMKSAEERLAADLDAVEFRDPAFPVVCNVDARFVRTGNEAREALKRQVTRTVRWAESMDLLGAEGVETFVELGAGTVLSGLMKRIGRGWERSPLVLNLENPAGLEEVRAGLAG